LLGFKRLLGSRSRDSSSSTVPKVPSVPGIRAQQFTDSRTSMPDVLRFKQFQGSSSRRVPKVQGFQQFHSSRGSTIPEISVL